MKKTISVILVLALISMFFVGCDTAKVGVTFKESWGGTGSITLTTIADMAGVAFLKGVDFDDETTYTGAAAVTIDGTTITFTLPEVDLENETITAGETYEGTINSSMTRITIGSETYRLSR